MQGVYLFPLFLNIENRYYALLQKGGQKSPTLHSGQLVGLLGCAGCNEAAQGPDTVLTSLGLVGQVSRGYKCPTCPKGANMTREDILLDAAGITLIFSLLFLFMSL